jgi:hypothetical protein
LKHYYTRVYIILYTIWHFSGLSGVESIAISESRKPMMRTSPHFGGKVIFKTSQGVQGEKWMRHVRGDGFVDAIKSLGVESKPGISLLVETKYATGSACGIAWDRIGVYNSDNPTSGAPFAKLEQTYKRNCSDENASMLRKAQDKISAQYIGIVPALRNIIDAVQNGNPIVIPQRFHSSV